MVILSKLTKKKLGELLVSEGLINDEQVNEALKYQKKVGGLLGESLVKLGYVTETDIAKAIATQFGLPYIDATRYVIDRDVMDGLSPEELMEHQLVPLDKIGGILIVAVAGMINEGFLENVEKRTGCKISVYVSTASQVEASIQNYYEGLAKKS